MRTSLGFLFAILLLSPLVHAQGGWPIQELLATADIQSDLRIQKSSFFNPVLEPDIRQQESDHRLLVGVIDHGVDYFHPQLKGKWHFSRDSQGGWRLGHDYVGADNWPDYKIARNPPESLFVVPGTRIEILKASSLRHAEFLSQLLSFEFVSELTRRMLSPDRDWLAEMSFGTSAHGTMVSGLVGYGRQDIGILPYRVFPIMKDHGQVSGRETSEKFHRRLLAATRQAIADGARVLNFSMRVSYDEKLDLELTRIANENPQVVFVAASGNEGEIMDSLESLTLPCGVEAANVVCVGGTYRDHTIMQMTNVPHVKGRKVNMVYTSGVFIPTTAPTESCDSHVLWRRVERGDWRTPPGPEEVKEIDHECAYGASQFGIRRPTGTSIATAVVSRLLGEQALQAPEESGAQLIQRLTSRGIKYKKKHPMHEKGPSFNVIELVTEIPKW